MSKILNFSYKETDAIRKLLFELEALKILFQNFKALPHIEEKIRRESLLKSSLYSARIEGNPAEYGNIEDVDILHKLEISNLLSTYKYIYSNKVPGKLSINLIKEIHKMVMKNISPMAGSYRSESWAVFNKVGEVVYLPPAHFRVPGLMNELISVHKKNISHPFIKCAAIQFLLEKVHPFADGNGRVGRLLSAYILSREGYGFRNLVPVEEIVDNKRLDYYQALEPNKDVTLFVEFMLESFIEQARLVSERLMGINEEKPEDFLFPRRREIFEIIKDHPFASFNFLSRRFSKVNIKTLHYDLKKLQEKGFIIKIGETRGATYKIKNDKTR
jgi:Fic family protein